MQTKKPESGKLQFRIDIILTVIFIAAIFFMGVMTVIEKGEGIYFAAVSYKNLGNFVEDPFNCSHWDRMEARVKSVDSYLTSNVYGADALGEVNSTFQYALGKQMVTTGGSSMVRLNTGHLYDLQNYIPMDKAAENILDMKAMVPDGVPFLFVYEHPTLYSDEMMPAGYDVLDYLPEMAEEISEKMAAAGVNMIDSREVLTSSGLKLEDYLYYTDQHWSTRAAIVMAQRIAQELSRATGVNLHPEKLDISQFDTQTHSKLFLGKYGQRIGTRNVDPDDIITYSPKYPTNIHRYTNYLGEITDLTGPFEESVMRPRYLKPLDGKTYNTSAYFDYGLTENYDLLENPDGADLTILLLKDSYSAPIGAFLSLTAGKIASIDLRRSDVPLDELIRKYRPDAVVVAYSMQMLRDDNYEFQ